MSVEVKQHPARVVQVTSRPSGQNVTQVGASPTLVQANPIAGIALPVPQAQPQPIAKTRLVGPGSLKSMLGGVTPDWRPYSTKAPYVWWWTDAHGTVADPLTREGLSLTLRADNPQMITREMIDAKSRNTAVTVRSSGHEDIGDLLCYYQMRPPRRLDVVRIRLFLRRYLSNVCDVRVLHSSHYVALAAWSSEPQTVRENAVRQRLFEDLDMLSLGRHTQGLFLSVSAARHLRLNVDSMLEYGDSIAEHHEHFGLTLNMSFSTTGFKRR